MRAAGLLVVAVRDVLGRHAVVDQEHGAALHGRRGAALAVDPLAAGEFGLLALLDGGEGLADPGDEQRQLGRHVGGLGLDGGDDEQVHGFTATASTSATVDAGGMIIDVPGLSRRA